MQPARLIKIEAAQAGQRLDNFLIKTLKSLPKSRLYRIIRKGEVRVNKKRIKPEYRLQPDDLVRIPPLATADRQAQDLTFNSELRASLEAAILHEDDSLLVINKPAGLAVHSGSGLHFGVIDIMRDLRPGPGLELVHRLDRDTSGCLLLAKNRAALLEMQGLIQHNALRKFYLAMVKGHWNQQHRRIRLPLRRETMPNGERKVFVDERGQEADTRIDRVEHFIRDESRISQLHIQLITGRTHQIRVHCQAQGHAIVGDAKYGDRAFNRTMRRLGCKRLMLHAYRLEIPQNRHTQELTIEAPVPSIFKELTTG